MCLPNQISDLRSSVTANTPSEAITLSNTLILSRFKWWNLYDPYQRYLFAHSMAVHSISIPFLVSLALLLDPFIPGFDPVAQRSVPCGLVGLFSFYDGPRTRYSGWIHES